ncbi:MAG TPA: GNAT family N-acetyltransferase [Pseudacidobacterium sp.]|jgi:predicted GNAT superfamily acetyltransferase|nr:GNAT family N-acetyltransferase [Pseudacidobacterium sp.]
MEDRTSEILIRHCRGFEELDACVQLQIDVWGYADGDVIPRRVFTVTQKIGGQVIAAFDVTAGKKDSYKNLIGFAMSIPAARHEKTQGCPEPYLHSHMLAVNPSYRNFGIGQRLKLAQRRDALARGFRLMEWTFDPLEIKNSFLNIHRLGAIVRRYTPNFYGVSSSRLQGGLPTDRLHAEWWMQSERVEATLSGSSPASKAIKQTVPETIIKETIMVPRAVSEWKSSPTDYVKALEVQTKNREHFLDAFARGLAVIGFSTDAEGNGIFELGEWQEPAIQENR